MNRTQVLGLLGILAGVGCEEAPSEMDVVVVETGTVTDGPVTVGAGLSFDLALRVGSAPDFEPPTDLEVVPEGASTLLVEIVGPDSTGRATVVRLTPQAPGAGSVRFFADNAVEDPTFRYDAVEIDEAELTATVQGDNESETSGPEITVFVGSRVFFEALYRSGGQRVLGRELLEVDAPADAGTEFLDLSDASLPQLLDVDETPHDAIVRSPASGDIFTVHAVDVTAVWLTELLTNGEPFAATAPYEMTVGDEVRVDLVPSSRPGARIWGLPPTPAEWDIRGDSVSETGRDGDGLYLEAVTAGDTNILFTYGAAQAAMEIAVSR